MQFDVIKKLLPRGVAFGPEAKRLYVLLYGVSMEFDRVKSRALDVLTEVPGNLSERLDSWAKILEISGSDEEKKQGVSAKLVATGGQSPEYLLSILKKYRVQIRLEPDRGRHRMRVIGALDSISEFTLRVPEIKTGGRRINAPLRSWKRDEALIEGFETLKHAETEARYHLWTE